MGSLFASLLSTANSLRAYDRSLSVIQNNVSNAESPGFARQRLTLIPKTFSPRNGLAGGVEAGALISSRDSYAERNVWKQQNLLGHAQQTVTDLTQIEPFFPISENAGIPGALGKFFNAVSSWSVNPNDTVARQVVLDRASAVSRSFNENSNALGVASASADREIRNTVDTINSLAERLRDLSHERRSDRRKKEDPALDANIHAVLEELSTLADFNVLEQPDGSYTLLFGGQTPLVQGNRLQKLSVDFSFGQPVILDDQQNDITNQLTQGSLKGLFETRNTLIPGYLGDLNRLAQTFADRVNQVLGAGVDATGSTPTLDLFTYDPIVGTAATLRTNPLDPSQLAGADSASPGGNGNTLALFDLSTSREIDDVTLQQFYGELGGRVGRDLLRAKEAENIQEQMVNQADRLREERSGVSLDEEAARLIEAQRAYQANAQLFTVLNELTDTLLGLLR